MLAELQGTAAGALPGSAGSSQPDPGSAPATQASVAASNDTSLPAPVAKAFPFDGEGPIPSPSQVTGITPPAEFEVCPTRSGMAAFIAEATRDLAEEGLEERFGADIEPPDRGAVMQEF